MDPMTIGLVLGAGSGLLQSQAKQRAEKANMIANAEAMRWSPWTGIDAKPMQAQGNNMLADIAGGAASGAMFGKQFGGMSPNVEQTMPVMPTTAPKPMPPAMPQGQPVSLYSAIKSPYMRG